MKRFFTLFAMALLTLGFHGVLDYFFPGRPTPLWASFAMIVFSLILWIVVLETSGGSNE
jgi:hypothetical protein